MKYSCKCGRYNKDYVNDVLLDLVCHICGTKLELITDISRQTKLESFYTLDEIKLGERRQKIYEELLKETGSDQEIAHRLGYKDPNFVRPRRKELLDLGLVRAKEKRDCKITGKKVIIWEAI